jgi:FPC/CPF motif-containing protein YcgG
MNEIIYPAVRTYYICFDDERTEVKSYGWVEPNQVFQTIWIFDEFTDEAAMDRG